LGFLSFRRVIAQAAGHGKRSAERFIRFGSGRQTPISEPGQWFAGGYAENAAMANGFLEPGMEMVTKPFAVDTLATRIRDMIGA
jgi:hypothetical protein